MYFQYLRPHGNSKLAAVLSEAVAPRTVADENSHPERSRRSARATRSSGERSAQPHDFGGLGIHKNESLLHQRFLVIENHAVQIDKRLRIDEHPHIAKLEDAIAFAWLRVETNVIAQTGTAAALYAKAQSTCSGEMPSLAIALFTLPRAFSVT